MNQQYQYGASTTISPGALIVVLLVSLAVSVFLIATMWRVFTKAGQPGWAAIVPFYNTVVLLRVVGRPWWWLLLMFIPFVNIVLLFIVYVDLAKSFGKGTGFGVLTVFFPYICLPILAFGDARYVGPAGSGGQPQYPGQPPYPGQQQYPPQQYPGGPYQQQYPGQQYGGQQQYPPQGQQYPGQRPGGYPYGTPQQYPGQQYPGQQYPPQQ
ncbi:DUF5684 domain-containing protein [Amycolatopsis pigmentata]|uniref:DUF5684 domain-containing protein n=1 Tax=Amycolatopsis pigmentata TaxID=450801 RepID=A0ABW5G8P4_9PSEU